MSVKKSVLALPALAIALSLATPADALFGQAKRKAQPAPPSSYQGQWYTTPDGCSYSRAKAPGYATMWVLIQNPHHIGQPPAGAHCATLLKQNG
ncbi:hypothetical protein [Roseovarius faecimaris]|uniref:hypothetical protein n=1 Tax=Roseovarius faecimaris TaxID=2494550 RepID=UPI0018DF632E|nr:hypothetical protein [Roseovarius faecimaris]